MERAVLDADTPSMMCHRAPAILAIVITCSMSLAAIPISTAAAQDGEGPRAADVARAIELATMRSLQVLARARRLDDARAVRCLDPRVSELNATYRQATERTARARRAEESGDEETVARETAIVRRLADRARTLERHALECVGREREVEADWTDVDVRRTPSAEERARAARRYARSSR